VAYAEAFFRLSRIGGSHHIYAHADTPELVNLQNVDGKAKPHHAGILVREGTLDGVPVKLGGIGGVKTHPQAQGRGYASAALRRAATALHDDHHVAFSLLVCQAHLLPFYGRLGWLPFSGRLVVEQPGGAIIFTINRPMVLPGLLSAPQEGVIDLRGLPW